MSQEYIWEYNGVRLEADASDADFQEKYEIEFERLGEAEKHVPKTGKLSEITRYNCKIICEFFDNVFGNGTADKLLNGKCNARLATECIEDFIDHIAKQANKINEDAKKRAQKYAPNRQQRRYQERNKGKNHNNGYNKQTQANTR